MSRLGSARIRNWATELLCVAAVLAPLTVCLASDVIHTSLWLDEVTYHYYEDDMALRAAELGRSGRFLAPYVGVFFNCDVQHLLHRVFRAFGLTLQRDPEAYLRLPSVVWYVVAVLAFYTFLRLRLSHRLDALLGGLSFSSTPIFLHYAFEARVYSLTLMLVVLLLIAVEAAGKKPTRGSLLLVAAFGLVAAHSQLWTVCLFFALVLVAGLQAWRLGRLTPWARAALAAFLPICCFRSRRGALAVMDSLLVLRPGSCGGTPVLATRALDVVGPRCIGGFPPGAHPDRSRDALHEGNGSGSAGVSPLLPSARPLDALATLDIKLCRGYPDTVRRSGHQ